MADRISACLIVKNEPGLERAVLSIRPHVDEVCIVDTGSHDGTAEVAARLADKFEFFTDCNFPDGDIADFSRARAKSFALASHETVVWLDADDTVENPDQLRDAIAWCHARSKGQPWRALFGYDYDQDAEERSISWQQRERVVYPANQFHWVYRVHEGLTCRLANEWQTLEPPYPIVWRHHCDKTKPRSRRNLRILLDHVREVGVDHVDPKTMFDLGMEFAKSGDHNLALAWMVRFVHASDLDDERMLACLHMVDVLSFWPGREQDAALWGQKAVQYRPDWPDGYFALAKLAYGVANKVKHRGDAAAELRHLARVRHFAEKGLALTRPRSSAPQNPSDATFNVPAILQDVLERLGDVKAAYDLFKHVVRADDPAAQLRLRELELRTTDLHAGKLDVAIVCGAFGEAWDPDSAARRGIGGSETAVIQVAKRLAILDCRVRVYCRCDRPGLYEGVEYRAMGNVDEVEGCDLLVAWRSAELLENHRAKVKWLWVHDVLPAGATPWNIDLADRVLALSAWHADHLRKAFPGVADRVVQTRNGIEFERFDVEVTRHPHRAIYSSSPDRGLTELLDMWPAILARVPDAELHVFYGFAGFPKLARDEFETKMAATPGVVHHDRVDQATLAREMLAAGAWLYPSWAGGKPFTETSCITAMEAQAAGLHGVCSPYGALPETARYCAMPVGAVDTEEYRIQFVDAAVTALTLSDKCDTWREPVREYARDTFGWDPVAVQWGEWAFRDVAMAKVTPITEGVYAVRPNLPTIHMILAPQASGDVLMDATGDPGAEAQGRGSRVGFLGLVRAMGATGRWNVRAYSTFRHPLVHREGVDYVRLDHLLSAPAPDVVLAYYDTSPLVHFDGRRTLRVASHHTYQPYMHFDSADVNVAPSQHAVDILREQFDPTGRWAVLPNAVGELPIERRPVCGRILYHTSADRGLHNLLNAYPEIRRMMPEAHLHVVGPLRAILDSEEPKGRLGDRTRELRASYARAEAAGGVVLLGKLPRAELWRELAEASVFAFPCEPTAPCETFSVSTMECCRLGIPVVLAPADALESIYRGHVAMCPSPASQHLDVFAETVACTLAVAETSDLRELGPQLAAQYTFDRAAVALEGIIRDASLYAGPRYLQRACAE